MIFYVSRAEKSGNFLRFISTVGRKRVPYLRALPYEFLFRMRRLPAGHYIFVDHDYLTSYERERAAEIAHAVEDGIAGARILNHPAHMLERTPLLRLLHDRGINDFTVTRIDAGEVPPRFPVFIRTEEGFHGPETEILNDIGEYRAALDDYAARNIPLKGRIAIGYDSRPDANGLFRKYGALRLGDRIIPLHALRSHDWCVKSKVNLKDDIWLKENAEYIRAFGDRELLEPVFDMARIQVGRIDYSLADGRLQVFEINTNDMPDVRPNGSTITPPDRAYVTDLILAAYDELEAVPAEAGTIAAPATRLRRHYRYPTPLPVYLRHTGRALRARYF